MASIPAKLSHTCRHLMLMTLMFCAGCEQVDAPIVAAMDSPDQDLVEYLGKMIDAARDLPESGLARGRLGMTYDINGQREAARLPTTRRRSCLRTTFSGRTSAHS